MRDGEALPLRRPDTASGGCIRAVKALIMGYACAQVTGCMQPVQQPPKVVSGGMAMAMAYELQQVRKADGSVGFEACLNNCEPPTAKKLAAATPQAANVQKAIALKAPTDSVPSAQTVSTAKAPAVHASTAMVELDATSLYRIYFRHGTAEFGPGALRALAAAIPELKTMIRLNISAMTDPTGTVEQNKRQAFLRQEAVKDYLVVQGISADRIFYSLDLNGVKMDIKIKGMSPRTNQFAEMRRADILAFAGVKSHDNK